VIVFLVTKFILNLVFLIIIIVIIIIIIMQNIKELQSTAMLGTAHILRKVLI